jgi:hypothetical protein
MAQTVSREALCGFFALHKPPNVENVDVILSHYADDPAAMIAGLRKKYGDTPKMDTPPVPSKDLAHILEHVESHDLVKSGEETGDASAAQKKASDPPPLVPAAPADAGRRGGGGPLERGSWGYNAARARCSEALGVACAELAQWGRPWCSYRTLLGCGERKAAPHKKLSLSRCSEAAPS